MSTPPHASERRRSTRALQAVPITVSGIDLVGQPFKELTRTVTVNHHGCTYRSKHRVPKGTTVTLEIAQRSSTSPARRVQGRVTWVQRSRIEYLLYDIGVEFEKPENVWGIEFPLEDRSTPPDDGKKHVTSHDRHKFKSHATPHASDLVEYVEEIIVEESSEDRIKDYIVASSQPRKTDGSIKAHQKKRNKKKKQEEKKWDIFLCHASEDKDSFVRPLANALEAEGLRVWFDESALRVGDGLRRSIDKGLQESKFGAVIISPSFFKKQWPQRELDGLVAKEIDDRRVILPVWHNVSQIEVREHSITLADRIAANSAEGIQAVVAKLLLAIRENG
jgi:TIR domain